MGPLPRYFDYYMFSCKQNETVDFIVINDSISKSYVDGNIRFIKMNLGEVNNLASKKLNTNIALKSAWKINELKPLFGNIFKEELASYDYWGWCDLDIIWGRIRQFLNDDILNEYDVVTSKEFWTAGHFTLLKNNLLCNNLYQRNTGIIDLLNNPVYYAFEESCHRWNGEINSFETLIKQELPISMFDIVKQAQQKGELKAHFKDLIREHPQPINYVYQNGVLTDLNNDTEFFYYHLITVKKIWRFYIPSYRRDISWLFMTPYGIRAKTENKLVWYLKRAYSCFVGIKKSAKTQSGSALIQKLFRSRK